MKKASVTSEAMPANEGQRRQLTRMLQDIIPLMVEKAEIVSSRTQQAIDDKESRLINACRDALLRALATHAGKVPDYELAKKILGVDFITPEEVTKARPGIVYSDEQITAFAGNLPSAEVLEWCKANDYAVMPAPPTSMALLHVREIQPAHFYSKQGGWYAEAQQFARADKTDSLKHWFLAKKTEVANSTGKSWNEQHPLLSEVERVPNVAEISWFITTYFEVRDTRLFEVVGVRTSSLGSGGNRVCVGPFHASFLLVGDWDTDERNVTIGVSSARKLF